MFLKEIKPLHFGFYKKKSLNNENIVELYSKDELICDVNVLKTISKYSNDLFISRKYKDLIFLYNEKTCLKFKPQRYSCYDIKKIFKKFVSCKYFDCLIMNVEGLFYSMSRLNQWNYSISLYLSLDNNYKDFLVEDVFDEPSRLVGDVFYVNSDCNIMFKLENLDKFEIEASEDPLIETITIDVDVTGEKESKARVIKYHEKEKSFIERLTDFFIKKQSKTTKKHTLRYGKKEGDRIYTRTNPIELLEFNGHKTSNFLINLINKLRTSSIDFIEIDCGVLIWIIKNSKGLFLFSNFEVDEKVSNFVKDFHDVFIKVKEKTVTK